MKNEWLTKFRAGIGRNKTTGHYTALIHNSEIAGWPCRASIQCEKGDFISMHEAEAAANKLAAEMNAHNEYLKAMPKISTREARA